MGEREAVIVLMHQASWLYLWETNQMLGGSGNFGKHDLVNIEVTEGRVRIRIAPRDLKATGAADAEVEVTRGDDGSVETIFTPKARG
jgi:hypothetical protein